MAIIVLDLEWNQGFPATPEEKFNEIIQIGAVRLETWDAEPEVFSKWVRPMYHRALHYRVRELVPVERKTLQNAPNFFQVLNRFRSWCGSDAQFVTWGPEDLRVFHENLAHYHLNTDWITREYDLQKAYGYLCYDTNQQFALKTAIEQCGMAATLTFHDASHDAYYTALIGKWLLERHQSLPDMEELNRIFAQRAEEKRQALLQEALSMAQAPGEALAQWTCGPFDTAMACISSREARRLLCPTCRKKLYQLCFYPLVEENRYVSKVRCAEHGTFFTLLHTARQADGQWYANASAYASESPVRSAFKICAKYLDQVDLEYHPAPPRRNAHRGRRR